MRTRAVTFIIVSAMAVAFAWAQESKPAGIVPAPDLKSLVPAAFFYRGQSATVQLRNSGAFRTKDQKYVMAALVDTAGYASDVAQKYQGLFITEVKIQIEGSELGPGEYGFGFMGDKFIISDVGAAEVLSVACKRDDNLKRPVPLKITQEGGEYRLYGGKKYVTLQVE